MFLPRSDFPWTRELEAGFPEIKPEFEALDRRRFKRWPEVELYNHGWEAFGLLGFGRRFEDNLRLCPRLAAILERIPGLTTAGFSVLGPGTVISPHVGYTSTVLRCHLGIVIPEDCGIRVGGETRTWREGECLVFDDTAEHEAWNRSEQARVVLLLDVVKPGETFDDDTPGRDLLIDYFRSG
jgi:ornithine lipid ester-linked acyl 2-hydroxylase